jgi:hypothetical protein
MGFLDHSTNNIIVDAVLTDYGRQMLANNQGNFRVAKFSFGDDEVDYTIIQKYGRAVGKEKIVKNTPVFEAQTKENLALKYRMLTINDPTVVYLPTLELRTNVANGFVDLPSRSNGIEIQFEQTIARDAIEVPEGLTDSTFTVIMPSRFLQLVDGLNVVRPVSTDSGTRTAYYTVNSTAVSNSKGGKGVITIKPQPSLDDTVYAIYSNTDSKDRISTVVSIIGESSGIRADFVVNINKQ